MENKKTSCPKDVKEEELQPGVDRAVVLEESAKCSGKVSDIARYLAYGIIITCFSLLTSTSPFAKEFVKQYMTLLVISTIISCLAAFFDLVQYNSGYWSSEYSLAHGKQQDGTYYFLYDWRYYTRMYSYRLKILLVMFGSLALLSTMSLFVYYNRASICGQTKSKRAGKAIEIETRRVGEKWTANSVMALSLPYSEYGDAKKAYFSNQLIPFAGEGVPTLINRISATCNDKKVAEMTLDETNMDSAMGFEFKCYDVSYRATLIEMKDGRSPQGR